MTRISETDRSALTPEQAEVYDAIVSSRGAIAGPFQVWLETPELADRAQSLGEEVRFRTSLDRRLSELAILVTARFWNTQFEWTVHEPLARDAGVGRKVIEAIRSRRAPEFDRRDEESVYRYATQLLEKRFVEDSVFAAARDELGTRGVTELTLLLGYYTLVSFSLNAFEVPLPRGMEALLTDAPAFLDDTDEPAQS